MKSKNSLTLSRKTTKILQRNWPNMALTASSSPMISHTKTASYSAPGHFVSCSSLRFQDRLNTLPQKGYLYFFHSDGNYHAIIPSLIEAGFVGLHCIDKNCGMYPDALFKEYKDSFCLWGTIDVAEVPLLHTQEASEIHTELSYIKALMNNNRLILGTTSGLYPGIDIYRLVKFLRRL